MFTTDYYHSLLDKRFPWLIQTIPQNRSAVYVSKQGMRSPEARTLAILFEKSTTENKPNFLRWKWTITHRRTSVGWPARTNLHQVCAETWCSLQDLSGAKDDRENRAISMNWWDYIYIYIYTYIYVCVYRFRHREKPESTNQQKLSSISSVQTLDTA